MAATQLPPDYTTFTVLLDDPAEQPSLGFDVYADAFSQMIEHSRPRFAIGIFGDWGSGKTTLMRAIESRVAQRPDTTLAVWFNAWRYEKEEHLIVPLLDHLREGLLGWTSGAGGGTPTWAARAASLFGRAARRMLRGLTIEGGVPGATASFDFAQVIDAPAEQDGPASFYHAAFQDMREATEQFAQGQSDRRIVVFVDDLDRCLPTNALQVLESMKLFFDLEGFVFVVGLDRSVIERSIEAKYEGGSPSRAPVVIERVTPAAGNGAREPAVPLPSRGRGERTAPISGAEYIKKVFQVPFALPRVGTNQLGELLDALRGNPAVPPEQGADLEHTVRPHIAYLTDRDSLNPREVKRLVNAYTLQMKLLYPRLAGATSPDTVLAIQLMGFREDWDRINNVLLGDPDGFLVEVRRLIEHQEAGEPAVLGEDAEPVPPAFLAYLRNVAGAMIQQDSLVPYVSSAEQTRTSDPGSLSAQQAIRRLRRTLRGVAEGEQQLGDPSILLSEVRALRSVLDRSVDSAPDLYEALFAQVERLEKELRSLSGAQPETEMAATIEAARRIADEINDAFTEIRRRSAVGIA